MTTLADLTETIEQLVQASRNMAACAIRNDGYVTPDRSKTVLALCRQIESEGVQDE